MTTATTCAKCPRATRPLPTDWSALDFFDKPVAAQDAVFRVGCGVELDANKPCLRPAPAAEPAAEPARFESELFELRNIVGLCSFATEARRVLEEIDQVAKMRPDVGALLNQMIDARRNWSELGDYASDALNDVRQRMNALLGEEG